MANSKSSAGPAGSTKTDNRNEKGAAQPRSQGIERPARPLRGTVGNQTGTNPGLVENDVTVRAIQQAEGLDEGARGEGLSAVGFSEDQTKEVELSSGGGLAQDDGNLLRGEDQLVDGDGTLSGARSEEE